MTALLFKKGFEEGSQPRINTKDGFNSILQKNSSTNQKFDIGSDAHINPSMFNNTILSQRPRG